MKKIMLLSLIAVTLHAANEGEKRVQEIQNTDPPQGSYLFAISKYKGLLSSNHILFFIYKNKDNDSYILQVPQWDEPGILSKKTYPTSSPDLLDAEFTWSSIDQEKHAIRIRSSVDLIQYEYKKINTTTLEETSLHQENSKLLYHIGQSLSVSIKPAKQ